MASLFSHDSKANDLPANLKNVVGSSVSKGVSAACTASAVESLSIEDAEAILGELEYTLKMLKDASAESKQQKLDLEDIEAILFTWNACWLINKARDLPNLLGENPDLTERFNDVLLEFLEETEELEQTSAFFEADDESKLYNTSPPWWYYYFGGSVRREDDPSRSHEIKSYIKVTYTQNNSRKLVRGEIWFFLDEDNNGNPEYVIDFPVIWNVKPGGEQTFYFSCHIAPLDPFWENSMGDPYLPLRILGRYWYYPYNARKTLYTYRFCESYYCCNRYYPQERDCVANPPPQGFPYWGCVAECLNDLHLEETARVAENWRDRWHRSPLLIYTPHDSKWWHVQRADYFDRIALWASEDIEILNREVVLNGETLFKCWDKQIPPPVPDLTCLSTTIKPDQALDLTRAIDAYRLNQLDLDIPPSQMPWLLIEAARDIGQTWEADSLCGELWFKADVTGNPWRPIPNDWCGDFVRGKIRDYSGLPILPCCDQEEEEGEEKDREPLWYYFGRLDEYFCQGQYYGCECIAGDDWNQDCDEMNSYCGRYRISFRDRNPFTINPNDRYTWESLADPAVVRPGYVASLMSADRDDFHQTIFLEWDSNYPPEQGECIARFRAIGGNQGDRTNIRTFWLCNGTRQDCWDNYCVPHSDPGPNRELYYTWGGLNDNDDEVRSFFGRPRLWRGNE